MPSNVRRIAAGVLLAGLVQAAPAAAQDLPEMTIPVTGAISFNTQYTEVEKPFWTDHIPKVSGGKITAQIQAWTDMGMKGQEVLRLAQRGVFKIATVNLGYNAGDNAIVEAHDLAGVSPNIDQFRRVTEASREMLAEGLAAAFNVKVLAQFSYSSQVLYCSKPFQSFADLKGRKVRISGTSQGKLVEYFGANGIYVAFAETQQALQKGVIDCAITGSSSGYQAKWHEVTSHISPVAINWGAQAVVANLDWWKDLDPRVQAFLEAELKVMEGQVWELSRRESQIGLDCNTGGECPFGEPGRSTLVEPSEADLTALREAVEQSVLPDWAKRCGPECAAKWNATVGKELGMSASAS